MKSVILRATEPWQKVAARRSGAALPSTTTLYLHAPHKALLTLHQQNGVIAWVAKPMQRLRR